MMILFMMLPCTAFKHTITAIALITLHDYLLCKYIKRTIANQINKRSFLLQVNKNDNNNNNEVVSQFTCKGKFINNLCFI